MLHLRGYLLLNSGAFEPDNEVEGEMFSENEIADPHRGPEDPEFHPTPQDIGLVRSCFPLPPELVTLILDFAEYWVYSQTIRSDYCRFYAANERYLQSEPILGGEFSRPLRRLVVTTRSKDQGWSSYLDDHGTRENSWTWFELTLDDGSAGEEIMRVEVMRNIHAGLTFETHLAVIEDKRILDRAKEGDKLSVWARAMYPAWCNNVQSVKIEAWVAC